MKKWLVFLCFLCLIPTLSSAIGWFNVTRAEYILLDNGYYRLKVEVNYGGDNFYNFDRYSSTNLGYTGNFNAFYFDPRVGNDLTNASFSATQGDYINRPGFWREGGPGYSFNTFEFGYDFTTDRPLGETLDLNYSAIFTSNPIWSIEGEARYWSQNFSGTVVAEQVPEPASFLLFAFGLTGIGVYRYLRK